MLVRPYEKQVLKMPLICWGQLAQLTSPRMLCATSSKL